MGRGAHFEPSSGGVYQPHRQWGTRCEGLRKVAKAQKVKDGNCPRFSVSERLGETGREYGGEETWRLESRG